MVALKEDMRRTRIKLKLAQQNKKQAEHELEDQHSRVAKLQQDLDRVNAGSLFQAIILTCLAETSFASVLCLSVLCVCSFIYYPPGRHARPYTTLPRAPL